MGCKLDQEQRQAAALDAMSMLEHNQGDDDSNNDRVENNSQRKRNFEEDTRVVLPSTYSFLETVDIAQSRWEDDDTADILKYLALLHMQHSISVADEGVAKDNIHSEAETRNCLYPDMGVNSSETTTGQWKTIQNSVLDVEQG